MVGELRLITRYANAASLDIWVDVLESLELNRYEGAALRGYFEEVRRLFRTRDAIDDIRNTMPASPEKAWGWQKPTRADQRKLWEATKAFFDNYYAALSALSGVVSRFSDVFARTAISDNGPFLKWLEASLGVPHDTYVDLERARLFRSMLAHPQQFPPYDWATACYPSYAQVHIVLFGPAGRGKSPIPRGGTRAHPWLEGLQDWQFVAPDEASITNSFVNASLDVMAKVVSYRTKKSGFTKGLTAEKAKERLSPLLANYSPMQRSAPSRYEE